MHFAKIENIQYDPPCDWFVGEYCLSIEDEKEQLLVKMQFGDLQFE